VATPCFQFTTEEGVEHYLLPFKATTFFTC
jgi:hypothetical protein